VTLEQARAAKAVALKRLRRVRSVVGIGITRVGGEYALKINLREPLARGVRLPADVDGVSVRVEVVGVIRSHP
jgi:hypothetical protein